MVSVDVKQLKEAGVGRMGREYEGGWEGEIIINMVKAEIEVKAEIIFLLFILNDKYCF